MDNQPQQVPLAPGPTAATGATGPTGPTAPVVGREITDKLAESERNYSGNLGNDTLGGPGAGTPPGNTSQRDATGSGGVSDTGSAAGAPIPTPQMSSWRQGASGMGASGSSADVEREEFKNTHEEDGSLKAEEQEKLDKSVEDNKKAQEEQTKRIQEARETRAQQEKDAAQK